MSGVEVVGFVLGAFPLLISAAEHYKEGFEPLVKWKRFRTDFIGFIDAVDIEKQLFDQMLERFLISADVPQEEIQCFLTILHYEGWQRKDLAEILKSRLGSSYAVFSSTIGSMKKLMDELQSLLSLKNGDVDWANEGASKWDYQLKRIHLSFSKKGTRTLASLESQNRKLRELLDSNDKLNSLKAVRKDITWGTIFECIRKHASSLHAALAKGWQCDCPGPHLAGLRLQQRTVGGWSSTFNVSFGVTQESNQPPSIRQRQFVMRIKEVNSNSDATTLSPSPTQPSQGYLSSLRHNFQSKSTPQVNLASRPISSTAVLTSTSSQLKEYPAKTISNNSQAGTSSSCIEVIPNKNSPRNWLSGRENRPKTFVRMEIPRPMPISSVTAPAALVFDSHYPSVEIKDLCSALCSSGPDVQCLGYLCDDQKRQHEIRPAEDPQFLPGNEKIVSLETLLTGTRRLSRHDRFKVASILASSLLQLQSTPWLADKMEKKSIFFYSSGSKVLIEHPYVRQSFSSVKTTKECPTPAQAKIAAWDSLGHLGILLLELCFAQTIENQDMRKKHLGSDGTPVSGTDYMTARDWAEMVYEEEPDLACIIKCCVTCSFVEKADWENKKFTQAVYASVVAPLENIINKWPAS